MPGIPQLQARLEPNVENAGATRKLAVILAADVAGYSRLMAADDEGTLATLNVRRQVIDELITRHHGRIFTTAGDSVMAEFASPVEAVRCAAAIQQEIERRNADLPSRAACSFGSASTWVTSWSAATICSARSMWRRLEGVAEPGGIRISGAVYDQIRTRSTCASTTSANDAKNIGYPVRLRRAAGWCRRARTPSRSGRQDFTDPALCLAVNRRAPVREPWRRSRGSRRTSPTASPRT